MLHTEVICIEMFLDGLYRRYGGIFIARKQSNTETWTAYNVIRQVVLDYTIDEGTITSRLIMCCDWGMAE